MAFSNHTDINGGFTVVEMLVTAGILLVLGAGAVPAAGRVLSIRGDVACLSNLRQIGLGIQAYATDNQDTLPGPLQSAQYPYWNYDSQLSKILADYLAVYARRKKLTDDGKNIVSDVFVCPAFKRAVGVLGDAPVYSLNIYVTMRDGAAPVPPFGYPCDDFPKTFGTSKNIQPLKRTSLADIVDAEGRPAQTSTWMLKDVDQQASQFGEFTSIKSKLPKTMVHGRHRNALFFDFHVGAVDQDVAQ